MFIYYKHEHYVTRMGTIFNNALKYSTLGKPYPRYPIIQHWSSFDSFHPSATCMSVKQVSLASGNGLLPVWCQAIIWSNADILSIRPSGINFKWRLNRNTKLFINENLFENVVCKMVAILSRVRWVNSYWSIDTMVAFIWVKNACWVLISEVLLNSIESNFTVSVQATILHNEF